MLAQYCNYRRHRTHHDGVVSGKLVCLWYRRTLLIRQVDHKNAVRQHVPRRLVADGEDPGRHALELSNADAAALRQPVKDGACKNITGREARPVALSVRERRQHPFPMAKRLLGEPDSIAQLTRSVLHARIPLDKVMCAT